MYYVYILYSENHDKYYIGQTNDVKARLERHNNGLENFTSKYIPWILVRFITKTTRAEAVVLEKKLKNLSRERLLIFIAKYCNLSWVRMLTSRYLSGVKHADIYRRHPSAPTQITISHLFWGDFFVLRGSQFACLFLVLEFLNTLKKPLQKL